MKKALALIIALAMVLGTMSGIAFAEDSANYVAQIAGTDVYFTNLNDAFTSQYDGKAILLLCDCMQDVDITSGGYYSFYLQGYTITGTFKTTNGSVNIYGGADRDGGAYGTLTNTGVDGKYPLYNAQESGGNNIHVNECNIVATDANGVAVYATGEKTNILTANVTGKIEAAAGGLINIYAGTYNGDLVEDARGTINISGGTFTCDPSAFLPAGYEAENAGGVYTIKMNTNIPVDEAFEKDADGAYLLKTADDIVLFRLLINVQNPKVAFSGKTFKLANDIDLAGKTLDVVCDDSHRFGGTFDGNGKTIKNFSLTGTGDNVGFFGLTYGATIKNVTFENVAVTGGNYTGAVVGYARTSATTVLDNVTVKGDIAINGKGKTAAVIGGGQANVTNCTVSGNGSINGSIDVAGLIGLVSAGSAIISNNEVEGIEVNSNNGIVGGLAGRVISAGLTIENNSVSDVDITCAADSTYINNCGLIFGALQVNSGELTLKDNTFPSSTLTVAGVSKSDAYVMTNYDGNTNEGASITTYVAKIGTEYYTTLKEAIEDVVDGTTIYLLAEVNEGSIKLPAVLNNFTIDGQGNTVKNTTINAFDGGSVVYKGFTVKNTIFDNSRFFLGGQRAGEVTYKDVVFDGNTFKNIIAANNMAAVHMGIDANDENIESFTFTNNIIDGVEGSNNSAIVIKGVSGTATIKNNIIKNVAWNAIQAMYTKENAVVEISENEFSGIGADEGVINLNGTKGGIILKDNEFELKENQPEFAYFTYAAKVGNVAYGSLQKAIDEADAGDVVTLTANISAEVMPTSDGMGTDSNCFVHTDANDVITLDLNGKTISVKGSDEAKYDTLAIKNYGNLTIMDSSVEKTGTITLAFDGTQEVGSSQIHSTILNFGTLTINSGNIKNTATTGYGRYTVNNYSWGGNATTVINGGVIDSDTTYAVYANSYSEYGYDCHLTVNGGAIDGLYYGHSNEVADASLTITGGYISKESDYAVGIRNSAGTLNLSVSGGEFSCADGDAIAYSGVAAKFISGGKFSSNVSAYAAEGFDVVRTADGYVVEGEAAQADSISVVFKKLDVTETGTDTVEGSDEYAIVIKANDSDEIHELASADLTFEYTTAPAVGGAIDFTVAPTEKFSMSRVDNTNRYMFNYDGVGAWEGTANAITIGTIKVTGYGTYTIATAGVTTNIVNATTVNDNLVDSYTVAGATDNDATTGALDISDKVDDGAIKVPTRTLTINVTFPNEVKKQAAAYQDMKVEITGNIEGVNKTVTYNLGEGEIAMVDGKYVVTESRLVLNNAYTVTVSGAGYRTARYTVTMTGNKELNFWNNVMDEAKAVEVGKDSSKTTKNFLAGDIVKDNQINIYDLSAVVSYFASISNVENGYAKYDLNRDGVIDSKDVAYVLVSWGE